MKKLRKLIPALSMLLVSATVLASSTFAWFSMNEKVDATGLTVTATANTEYLVIGTAVGTDGKVTTGENLTETALGAPAGGMTVGSNSNCVYPVSKVADANKLVDNDGNALGKYSDGVTTITNGDWYTANSPVYSEKYGDKGDGKMYVENVKNVTEGQANYFLTYKVYLGLENDSAAMTKKDLQVKLTGDGTQDASIKVMAKVGSGVAVDITTTAATVASNISIDNNANTADGKHVAVTIYVYIDGTGDNVKNGAKTITGTYGVEFKVVDHVGA